VAFEDYGETEAPVTHAQDSVLSKWSWQKAARIETEWEQEGLGGGKNLGRRKGWLRRVTARCGLANLVQNDLEGRDTWSYARTLLD